MPSSVSPGDQSDSITSPTYIDISHVTQELYKKNMELVERNKAFNVTKAINNIILQTLDFDQAVQLIADTIPKFLGYQTGVLAIVDKNNHVLRRVAISATAGGIAALDSLEIPFASIEIDLNDQANYCIKALNENKIYIAHHLYDVLRPAVTEENSNIVQNKMGTQITLVYPIYSLDNNPLGTLLVSMDKSEESISEFEKETINSFVDSVRIALVNTRNYTSLKKMTNEFQITNEKLKQLDKTKDEFVSLASHELRTPMTVIKSYVWMLLQGKVGMLSEKQKMYLERTYSSTERLINLVNDMLNISRIESGRLVITPKRTDMAKLLLDITTELNTRAQELGIHLIYQPMPNLPPTRADAERIKQVVINLIGNSFKFVEKDGSIVVRLFEKDGFIVTQVTDNGKGISVEDIPKLFQKFNMVGQNYMTKQNAQGTGLGLYLSKQLIELHGGKIWAESAGEGKGSTFSFTLPVAPPSKEVLPLPTPQRAG